MCYLSAVGLGRALGTQALLLVLVAHSAPVRANPVSAETLFQEAVKLRLAGRPELACPKFEQSQQLDPARGTLLNIAMCHEGATRLASAWASYQQLADEAMAATDLERLELAREALERIDPAVPRLVIVVDESAPKGLEVLTNDVVLVAQLYGTPLRVDPGEHVVSARALGHETMTWTVTLAPGGSETVEIAALVPMSAPVATASAGAAPWPRRKRAALAIAGIALVGAGVGSYFGLAARSDWKQSASHCSSDRSICDDDGRALITAAADAATYSNISFALAAAAGLGALALWLTAPSPQRRDSRLGWRLSPSLEQPGAVLTLSRRFD